MPAFTYRAVFGHQLTGSLHQSVTTSGFRYTGAGTELAADVAVLRDAWKHIVQSMSDVWKYDFFELQSGLGSEFLFEGIGQMGSTAHTPCTGNIAFLLKKLTGIPGKANRGRMFVPGCSEQDVDALGTVLPSKLTELQGNLNLFNADIAAAHWHWTLIHPVEKGQNPFVDGTNPTDITDIHWATQCATQRRRMPRLK
jgi:hypothetical protein